MELLAKFAAVKRLFAPVFYILAILFAVIQCGARGLGCGVSFLAGTTPYKFIHQYTSLSKSAVMRPQLKNVVLA